VQEADARRCHLEFPAQLRCAVVRAREHEETRERLSRAVRDIRRQPADLLEAEVRGGERVRRRRRHRRLDRLELRDALRRAHDLHPAGVEPWVGPVHLAEAVVAVLLLPKGTGDRVEGHPEAVPEAVGEDLLDVRADLAADRRACTEERIARRRRAVVVEPEDDAGQVGVVRLRAAELIVVDARAERAVDKVLQLPPASVVADDDVELLVRAEADHPAVVIAAQRLPRISLERPQLDDVLIERERRAVPDETIDSVAEQRNVGEIVAVGSAQRLRPVQVDPAGREEVRVQRDPEQSSLGRAVHRQVEHGALHDAVDDVLHLAGGFLEHEHVVRPEKGHADRLVEPGCRRPNREVRVDDTRRRRGASGHERRHQHRAEHCCKK
jgi:hypothetical protein